MATLCRRIISLTLLFVFFSNSYAATTLEHYKRAFAYYRRQKYVQAIKIWRAVLKHRRHELSRKQQVKTCLGLANAYDKLGKKKHALKVIKYAQRLAPRSSLVKKTKARIAGSSGGGSKKALSVSEALEALETGLMMEKATSGQGKPHFNEAMPAFEQALTKGRSVPFAHYGIGTCLLYTSSDLGKAENHLREALKLRPKDSRINLQMAKLLKQKNDLEGEIACLDACVQNGGSTPAILAALAGAYGRRNKPGDTELVLRHARDAINYDSSYGESIVMEVEDEKTKIELGKMIAKAELSKMGDKEQKMARQFASKLKNNPAMVDKLKKKYGNKIPKDIANRIPAKYRSMFEKNKHRLKQYLGDDVDL